MMKRVLLFIYFVQFASGRAMDSPDSLRDLCDGILARKNVTMAESLHDIYWAFQTQCSRDSYSELRLRFFEAGFTKCEQAEGLKVLFRHDQVFPDLPLRGDLHLQATSQGGRGIIYQISATFPLIRRIKSKNRSPIFVEESVFQALLRSQDLQRRSRGFDEISNIEVTYAKVMPGLTQVFPWVCYGFHVNITIINSKRPGASVTISYLGCSGLDPIRDMDGLVRFSANGDAIRPFPMEVGVEVEHAKGSKLSELFIFVTRHESDK